MYLCMKWRVGKRDKAHTERLQRTDKQKRRVVPLNAQELINSWHNALQNQYQTTSMPQHQKLVVPLEAHPAGCYACPDYRIICTPHERRLFRVFLNTHPEPQEYQEDAASQSSVRAGLSTTATTTEPWHFCMHTSVWSLWGNSSKYCVHSHFLTKMQSHEY